MNIQNLILDINKKPFQIITANTGEVASRFIRVNIVDGATPMDITGVAVSMYAEKPDGKKVFNNVSIENEKNGVVLIELTSQVLAVEGSVKLNLLLEKDNARLCTKQFLLKVDKSLVDDEAIESINEFGVLTKALDKVDEWNGYFEETSGKIEEKYTERLNQVNSQLAHIENKKSNKSDVRLKENPITINDCDDSLLQAIEGGSDITVLSIPRNNSVTPLKTTFFDESTNLIDESKLSLSKSLSRVDGSLVDNDTCDVSDFIEALEGDIFIGNAIGLVCFYNDYELISWVDTDIGASFSCPSETTQIRVVFIKGRANGIYMLNKGDILLDYVPFSTTIREENIPIIGNSKIKEGSITTDKTSFFKQTNNMYNKNDVLLETGISYIDGSLIVNTTCVTSNKIIVEPKKKYTVTGVSIRRAFYTNEDILISTTVSMDTEVFEVPLRTSYMRISIPNEQKGSIMLNEGNYSMPFEEYHTPYLYNEYINKEEIKEEIKDISSKEFIFSTQNINTDYCPISVKAIDGTEDFNADTILSEDIYRKYDELASKYPDYISKTLLGKDSTDTFDIYKYEFRPQRSKTLNGTEYKGFPTIILTSGIHGDGSNAGDRPNIVCALYYFLKDVCENWTKQECLEYVRWNLNIIVIPVVNPWGFDNKDRRNGRQVDINRNFDLNWIQGVLGSNVYGGEAPFSEKESQYIRDLVNENKDAIFFCDFHTTGGIQTQDKMIYFDMSNNSILFNPANDLIRKLSVNWNNREYEGLNTNINFHGYIVDEGPAGICNSWVDRVANIPACTLETFPNFVDSELTTNGLELMQMACEEVGTWVLINTKFIYDYFR